MKFSDYHNHPQYNNNHRRPWNNLATKLRTAPKPTAYVILLILTYALGYYSGSSPSLSSEKPAAAPTTIPPTASEADFPVQPTEPDIQTVIRTAPLSEIPYTSAASPHNNFGSACHDPVRPEMTRKLVLEKLYNGTSPYTNFPPAHVAHLLSPKRVKGWGSYGAVFENLIRKVKPRVILEVGTFLGASATHMAALTRELGLSTQILCLDDFRGWPGFREKVSYIPMQNADVLLMAQFMQNVIYFNLTGVILPVPFSTGSGLSTLCDWGVMADLIEVDAGHDFHSAWSDINRAYKLLRPGGVMFGHDYFTAYDNKGVRRAVDLFARVNGFKVKTDGQHWVLDDSS